MTLYEIDNAATKRMPVMCRDMKWRIVSAGYSYTIHGDKLPSVTLISLSPPMTQISVNPKECKALDLMTGEYK